MPSARPSSRRRRARRIVLRSASAKFSAIPIASRHSWRWAAWAPSIAPATSFSIPSTRSRSFAPSSPDEPRIVELLSQEAKALSKVKSEAVVEYQGLFLDERGRRYLVMEYVDGPSLARLLRNRRLTPAEVRLLRDRLAEGLSAPGRAVLKGRIAPRDERMRESWTMPNPPPRARCSGQLRHAGSSASGSTTQPRSCHLPSRKDANASGGGIPGEMTRQGGT